MALTDDAGAEGSGRAPLRVGVAILYVADSRLLDATLTSFARSSQTADRVLLLEQATGSRALRKVEPPAGAEHFEVPGWVSAHTFALERLSDCDLIVFVKEGIVLGPGALAAERLRFEADPKIAVAQIVSRRTLDLETYLAAPDESDPFDVMQRDGHVSGGAGVSYFSPCIFSIAPKRGADGAFESFARRSEWAVHRTFVRRCSGVCVEATSSAFGAIVNLPDRRDSRRQGFELCEELNRFAVAFPEYRNAIATDTRTLLQWQLWGVLAGRRPVSRMKFLRGCVSSIRRNWLLRRKLNREVRHQ